MEGKQSFSLGEVKETRKLINQPIKKHWGGEADNV